MSSSSDSVMAAPRQCWICFGEEISDIKEEWLRPCKCKGSTKWVHEECLLDWINSQLTSNGQSLSSQKLSCPQCHHVYKVVEKNLLPKPIIEFLNKIEKLKNRLVFVSALSCISVGIYLISFAYGSVTFFITVGPEEAISYFKCYSEPLLQLGKGIFGAFPDGQVPDLNVLSVFQSWSKLILGLPMIPVWILSNRYRFFSSLTSASMPLVLYNGPGSLSPSWPPTPNFTALMLPIVYDFYRTGRTSLLAKILPAQKLIKDEEEQYYDEEFEAEFGDEELERDARVALRFSEESAMSLMLLPAASALLGWALFRNSSIHGFHRTCIGGAILMLASDVGAALYQYQSIYAKDSRKVRNYQP